MTTLDNLRARKLQLEQQLMNNLGAEHREQIEGELTKVDIALSFLDEAVKLPAGNPPVKNASRRAADPT